MPKPRKCTSIRLREETIKDIQLLAKNRGKTFSQALRLLIHTGFSNLGNWRKTIERDYYED